MSLSLILLFLTTISSTLYAAAFPTADNNTITTAALYRRDSVSKSAVIAHNFPDPSILWVASEKKWYAFATSGNGKYVQIATSSDFKSWGRWKSDALPNFGAWVDKTSPKVWAPMVIQIHDGSFVLYYAASSAEYKSHCIGVATSKKAGGPYIPRAEAFQCHHDKGGSIDPAGHQHPDGSLYVVYKVDGNAKGHGGSCNNGVKPIQSTPIMLQKVAADGYTKIGNEVQILDRDDGDGPLIEAPSLIHRNGWWYLFFSSGCFSSSTYDLSYATAKKVTGPYTKARAPHAPLLISGKDGLKAPGSACVTSDGSKMAFHAFLGDTISNGRGMWTAAPKFNGNIVTL